MRFQQHLARLGAVGRPHDTVFVQLLNDTSGPWVSDTQAGLQTAGAGTLGPNDDLQSLQIVLVYRLGSRGARRALGLRFDRFGAVVAW